MWICGWRFLKVFSLKTKSSKKDVPGVDSWAKFLSSDFNLLILKSMVCLKSL
jgi:hypothetical protein